MSSIPNPLRSAWRTPMALLGSALLVLALACGGGGGGGGSSTPTPQPFAELLFVSDLSSIRSISTSGTTKTELSTASIPGIPGTYARTGSLVTVTMPNHQMTNGIWAELTFSAGTGGTATSGKYKVTVVDENTFTLTDTASGTITGGTMLRKPSYTFSGTYVQSGTNLTVTVPNHGLVNNDQINLVFTSGGATNISKKIVSSTPDTFTVTMPSSATLSGNVNATFGLNYTIFDLQMHPSGKWLYATSGYDCSWGNPYCWGGDMISRFSIDWTTGALTFLGSVRATAKTNSDIPVGMAFNADGSKLFNQDDRLDGLRMWNVDLTSGAITFVAESAQGTTSNHGLVVSADGSRVYHGNNVFNVTATTITRTTTAGTSTRDAQNQIVNGVLYGVGDYPSNLWNVHTYSLANPAAPAIVGTFATGTTNQARAMAVSPSGNRIVTSGFGGLKSLSYDGTAITAVAGAGGELRDGGNPWPTGNVTKRMYRSISLNKDGNLLASAYFTLNQDTSADYFSIAPSGYVLVSLAADGSLALVSDTSNMYYSRVARFFKKP